MRLSRLLLVLAAALTVVLMVVVWFFPSHQDFRTNNPFWNGSSHSTKLPATSLESLSSLPASSQGSSLIVVPYLPFSDADLGRLSEFVRGGGTLILADDYGDGNQVLEYLGVKARFSGQPLLDPLSAYKSNPLLPRVMNFRKDALTTNVGSLVLNHAAAVTGTGDDAPLVLSSSFSFLDANNNGIPDKGDTQGPLPVISSQAIGAGRLVLVTDPSIFINSMDSLEGNATFIANITAGAPAGLYFDQSHLPPTNLHTSQELLAQVRGVLVTPVAALLLVLLVLAIALRPLWRRPASQGA